MDRFGRSAGLTAAAVVGLGLGGCASEAPSAGDLLPSADSLTTLPPLSGTLVVGTPTEVYTRVARGVLTCWFGASGPLKGQYIYHAQADPPSKGGRAQIAIHTKDKTAKDPRSIRAFRVVIAPGAERTTVDVENYKFEKPLAMRFRSDVGRWAGKKAGCGDAPMTAGWGAEDGAKTNSSKRKTSKTTLKPKKP